MKEIVLFHQDNAWFQTCGVAMVKIHQFGYELLLHLAYSPDLAPRDYVLFPNLKKWLGVQNFEMNEQVIAETKAYFESIDKTYYMEEITRLEKR